MQHLPFQPTPVTGLPYFSKLWQCHALCKRDDLFPEVGGGSKARMLQYILHGVTPERYDVVLTAGGPHSNFNRACALMCAKLGVKMHLVAYGGTEDEFRHSFNFRLCAYSRAEISYSRKEDVPHTIQDLLERYKQEGKRVKYIWGGGRELAGFYAYYEAVQELVALHTPLDAVFVACGTGTTLTGICAGMQRHFPHAKVYAVSVARSHEAEKEILLEDMDMLNAHLNSSYNFSNMVFTDSYLCGGYGQANADGLLETIKEGIVKEGLMLDVTYSGKALYGMSQIMAKGGFAGKNVLFWHTGGVFNMISNLC